MLSILRVTRVLTGAVHTLVSFAVLWPTLRPRLLLSCLEEATSGHNCGPLLPMPLVLEKWCIARWARLSCWQEKGHSV